MYEQLIFQKISYIFFIDLLRPGSIKIERGMEKIFLGSYSEIFWPDGKLIGAQSKVG